MSRKRPGGRDFRAFCRVGDRPAARLTDDGAALDAEAYDLDIDATHNFIANGIVTHNVEDSFPDAHVLELAHLDRVALAQLGPHGLQLLAAVVARIRGQSAAPPGATRMPSNF
jgi:hypothetical protein